MFDSDVFKTPKQTCLMSFSNLFIGEPYSIISSISIKRASKVFSCNLQNLIKKLHQL